MLSYGWKGKKVWSNAMLGGSQFYWQGVLAFLGLWWCYHVFRRLRRDRERLKESKETAERRVIIFYWVLTIPVIGALCWWVYYCFTHFSWGY